MKHLFLALLVILAPEMARADVRSRLLRVEEIKTQQVSPAAATLTRVMDRAFQGLASSSEVQAKARDLLAALRTMKTELEGAASESGFSGAMYQVFSVELLQFYSFSNALVTANSAFSGDMSLVPGDAIEGLTLQIPRALADVILAGMRDTARAEARQAGRPTPVQYRLPFEAVPVSGRSGVVSFRPAPEHLQRLTVQALGTYPGRDLARNTLRRVGSSLSILHLAQINSFLQPSDRVEVRLPSRLSSQERAFYEMQLGQSSRLVRESAYRYSFAARVVPAISALPGSNIPELDARIRRFFSELSVDFPNHMRPGNRRDAGFLTQVLNILGPQREQFIPGSLRYQIIESPQYFHLLRGEELANTLLTMAKTYERTLLVSHVECSFFVDASGDQSRCAGGAEAPRVFDTENGWTAEELAAFDAKLEALLDEMYPAVPQQLLAQLENLRVHSEETNASRRRYRLAADLIEGARIIGAYDRVRDMLADADGTIRQVPLEIFHNEAVDPGYMARALSDVNFKFPLDEDHRPEQWFGEVIGRFASQAAREVRGESQRQGDLRRRRFGTLLGVYGSQRSEGSGQETFVDAMNDSLNLIGVPVYEVASQVLSQRAAEQQDQDCTGLLGFMNCYVFSNRLSNFVINTFEHLYDPDSRRGESGTSDSRVRFSPNGSLRGVISAYQYVQEDPNRRWATMREQLAAMRHFLGAEDTGSRTGAMQFIEGYSNLLTLAEEVHSSALIGKVTNSFQALMRGNALPFARLRIELSHFENVLRERRQTLQWLFLPRAQRNERLRELLRDREIFIAYLNIRTRDFEEKLPGLFFELPVHSGVAVASGNPRPVKLYRVINGLMNIINHSQLEELMERVEQIDQNAVYRTETFNTRLAEIPLRDILFGALQGIRSNPAFEDATFRTMLGLSTRMLRGAGNGDIDPPHDDRWWPRAVDVIDVMPSLRDDYNFIACQNRANRQRCQREVKLLRILTSTILKPYLKSAAVSDQHVIEILANPAGGWERAALHDRSGILKSILDTIGTASGTGLAEMQSEVNDWTSWLESASHWLEGVNRAFFGIFATTLFTGMPDSLHRPMGVAMFTPAMSELGVNALLAGTYAYNYASLMPFSRSGMIPDSIVPGNQLNLVQAQYTDQVSRFFTRLPLDLLWAHGFMQHAQAPGGRGEPIAPELRPASEGPGRLRVVDGGRSARETRVEPEVPRPRRDLGEAIPADFQRLDVALTETRLAYVEGRYINRRNMLENRMRILRRRIEQNPQSPSRRELGQLRRQLDALEESYLRVRAAIESGTSVQAPPTQAVPEQPAPEVRRDAEQPRPVTAVEPVRPVEQAPRQRTGQESDYVFLGLRPGVRDPEIIDRAYLEKVERLQEALRLAPGDPVHTAGLRVAVAARRRVLEAEGLPYTEPPVLEAPAVETPPAVEETRPAEQPVPVEQPRPAEQAPVESAQPTPAEPTVGDYRFLGITPGSPEARDVQAIERAFLERRERMEQIYSENPNDPVAPSARRLLRFAYERVLRAAQSAE